jgi:hypothetical protein
MHQTSRQDKNRTNKNLDSKPIKKGKDTRAHRSLRLLPELEELTQLLTPDRASPALLLLNRNLYKWRTTSRVWYLEFHVVGRPPSLASTDFQLRIPCYRLLESVPVKPTREMLQCGAGRPGSLAGWPPPRSTGQWPWHTASSCQVHSRGDNYCCGILIFLVISWNALIWHLCFWN